MSKKLHDYTPEQFKILVATVPTKNLVSLVKDIIQYKHSKKMNDFEVLDLERKHTMILFELYRRGQVTDSTRQDLKNMQDHENKRKRFF